MASKITALYFTLCVSNTGILKHNLTTGIFPHFDAVNLCFVIFCGLFPYKFNQTLAFAFTSCCKISMYFLVEFGVNCVNVFSFIVRLHLSTMLDFSSFSVDYKRASSWACLFVKLLSTINQKFFMPVLTYTFSLGLKTLLCSNFI